MFALGTAQFGLDYGISNKSGKLNQKVVIDLLEYASEKKIDYLDTANVYGNSEEILGKLSQYTLPFKFITKTSHIRESRVDKVKEDFFSSLAKLKRDYIDILLVHNADELLGVCGDELYKVLCDLKNNGYVKKIGVSVYTAEEALKVQNNYSIDVIQFPINVINQSFSVSNTLSELHARGLELHARSVYLQGLLLMPLKEIPAYFNPILPLLKKYQEELLSRNMDFIEGALGYVKRVKNIDCIVFGVENKNQLEEFFNAYDKKIPDIDYSKFNVSDEKYINPALWDCN